MQVTGVGVGFIDVPAEHTKAYNVWYDQDHVPENLALPAVTGARRYVATPDCKAHRPPAAMLELSPATGTYFTVYQFGTDLEQAAAQFRGLGQEMRKRRRMFRHGNVPYTGIYRLDTAMARANIPVATPAIPYLGHQGVLVVLTDVPDASRRDDVQRWYEEVHAPDLLDVPGVAAAMRFSHVMSEGRYMNLYLLDGDPPEVAAEVNARRERWQAQGRLPSPGGASKAQFFSPYRGVTQTQYDFVIE